MQIPHAAAKQSLLRVFLLSMVGVAGLFTLMAIGIWVSTTDVLMREKQLIDELLPELDVAHQLTSATAGLQSQGFLLRSSQNKTDLENRQNTLELTIAEIQQTLDTTTSAQSGVIKDLRQSMEGIADITTGLTDARAQQIDSQQQVRQENHAIHEVLSDLEKDVQREVFALTGKLLSVSNAMKLADALQAEEFFDKEVFYERVSEYDDISLAIQDYLLVITKQIDDVGSDRFPKTAPVYYLKEMSALSAAMMQLDTAQKNMQAQDLQLQGINKELKNVNEELQQLHIVISLCQ